MTRTCAASRVALICSRRPGGLRRAASAAAGRAASPELPDGGVGGWVAFGSSRVVLRSGAGRGSAAMIPAHRGRPPSTRLTALRWPWMAASETRRLLTAELLSIGTELTVGDTRDTNAGELARSLTGDGRPGRPADGPARRSRRGRAAPSRRPSTGSTSSSRPAASARRRTTSRARRSPRSAARPRPSTRTSRRGCASCGRGAGCRSRSSTSSRPG